MLSGGVGIEQRWGEDLEGNVLSRGRGSHQSRHGRQRQPAGGQGPHSSRDAPLLASRAGIPCVGSHRALCGQGLGDHWRFGGAGGKSSKNSFLLLSLSKVSVSLCVSFLPLETQTLQNSHGRFLYSSVLMKDPRACFSSLTEKS